MLLLVSNDRDRFLISGAFSHLDGYFLPVFGQDSFRSLLIVMLQRDAGIELAGGWRVAAYHSPFDSSH
jgi:hypothetical protein